MKYGRVLLLAIALAVAVLLASAAQPAAAGDGDGLIKAGDPTRNGSVDITIQCERANKTVETIDVSVAILAADNASQKATKIETAIDALTPNCFTTWRTAEQITLDANAGNTIILIRIEDDDTNETIGAKCTSVAAVQGSVSFSGTVAGGGTATVSVPRASAQTNTTGKTTTEIMQALVTSLTAQGVGAVLDVDVIRITDDLAGVLLSAGNSDTGLALDLELERELIPAVGGLAELPDVSGSSGPNYVLLGGLAAAALVALGAGGWYARRRWVR